MLGGDLLDEPSSPTYIVLYLLTLPYRTTSPVVAQTLHVHWMRSPCKHSSANTLEANNF